MKKCLVLFSGGLDSRLAVKLMQEKGFEVIALHFLLPFGCSSCSDDLLDFAKRNSFKLKIFDCRTGKGLREYLGVLRNASHGRGVGFNPCIDCKIFMFKKAKEFADKNKIEFVVSGEVVGQRPMSQQKKQIEIVEEKSGLKKRILRPLNELGISGRQRIKQIELARKFKIKYPNPSGGCLLCEKALKNRFSIFLKKKLNQEQVKFLGIGRHFLIEDKWIILGRDEKENRILERFGRKYNLFIAKIPAPSAVVVGRLDKKIKEFVGKLILVYSKKGSLRNRKEFDKYKL